jgi:HD-GYP domain-containing protein (c-di-GMP phosphodiesterase class II)
MIPLSARIVAVADSCDAMLSDRPYRKGMPTERIDRILEDGAGSQWDPDVIAAFQRCSTDVYAIHQRGMGDSVLRAIEQVVSGTERGPNPPSIGDLALASQQS